jgi:Tol biopolymer transport system component
MGASFAWSQNGARLAYFTITGLSGPEDQRKYFTCVIDAYTRKEKCFEVGGGRFTLSPDGTKIVVVDGGVNIIDIDSGEKQIWMEDQDVDVLASVDWSPDGTKLAVPSLTGGITIIDVVSGEEYTVVESKEFDYFDSPRWSPDGKKIIYAKRSNIFIVNTDGSDNTLLVKNARNPAWSPDGTQIAYIAFAPGDYYQNNIILMNSDGTNKVKLTPSQYLYGDPMWSSDGNIIVFETFYGSRSNPQFDLYAVEVNSRKLINFTKSYNLDIYTLSPDRRAIYGVGSGGGLVVSLDGTILSEWKDKWCSVGPWRP